MQTTANTGDEARERELLTRFRNGEMECFYKLIRPYQRSVYLAAYSVVRNSDDAEEISQETFLKALRGIETFRGDSSFKNWLLTIAFNEARMRYRKNRKGMFEPLEEFGHNHEEGSTPRDFADWREIPSAVLDRHQEDPTPGAFAGWHEIPSAVLDCKEIQAAFAGTLAALPETFREVIESALGCTPAASNAHLIRGWKSVVTSEFEDLALPLLDSLYGSAFWLAQNQAEAEDLVQETYYKALRSFSSFKPGTNFKAWMLQILRNTFLSSRRALKHLESGLEMDEVDSRLAVDNNPESILLDKLRQTALQDRLQKALSALPVHHQEVIFLWYLEEMTYQEISETLSLPMGTVMSRLARARQSLKKYLNEVAR